MAAATVAAATATSREGKTSSEDNREQRTRVASGREESEQREVRTPQEKRRVPQWEEAMDGREGESDGWAMDGG